MHRALLHLQYTLILLASKKMPKQCVDYLTGQSRTRRTVGVRMPGDPICLVIFASPYCTACRS